MKKNLMWLAAAVLGASMALPAIAQEPASGAPANARYGQGPRAVRVQQWQRTHEASSRRAWQARHRHMLVRRRTGMRHHRRHAQMIRYRLHNRQEPMIRR